MPLAAGTLLFASTLAHAMERVNLRNGFSYDCVRSEALAGGRVRLYLNSGASSSDDAANYVDLPADRVAFIEIVPDPLPIPPSTAAGARAGAAADVRSLLTHAGSAHNIDVELLASVVYAESRGQAAAVSHTGAQGLMQLMPGTARELHVRNALDPGDNIDGGTAYLDLLLARFHDNLALALAAYNAGPAAVDHYHGVPPFRETRQYVVRVMTEFKRRKAALGREAALGRAAAGQSAVEHAPVQHAALAKF